MFEMTRYLDEELLFHHEQRHEVTLSSLVTISDLNNNYRRKYPSPG